MQIAQCISPLSTYVPGVVLSGEKALPLEPDLKTNKLIVIFTPVGEQAHPVHGSPVSVVVFPVGLEAFIGAVNGGGDVRPPVILSGFGPRQHGPFDEFGEIGRAVV